MNRRECMIWGKELAQIVGLVFGCMAIVVAFSVTGSAIDMKALLASMGSMTVVCSTAAFIITGSNLAFQAWQLMVSMGATRRMIWIRILALFALAALILALVSAGLQRAAGDFAFISALGTLMGSAGMGFIIMGLIVRFGAAGKYIYLITCGIAGGMMGVIFGASSESGTFLLGDLMKRTDNPVWFAGGFLLFAVGAAVLWLMSAKSAVN